jgi:hypothetical protein
MSLLLARQQTEQAATGSRKPSTCLEIALDPAVNKFGDLWHIRVEVRRRHSHSQLRMMPCLVVSCEMGGLHVLCQEVGCFPNDSIQSDAMLPALGQGDSKVLVW